MSNKKKLIPALRFPEFKEDGEWEEKKLGEVGEFIGGGTPSTTNPAFWDGDIQWYTPTEVKGGVLKSSIRKITLAGLTNSSAKLLPVGTILITTRATLGDVAITEWACCTNQGFQSLVVNDSEVNSFWYYWIFMNKVELEKRSSGSTFQEIGKQQIKSIPVIAPKRPEQQKIADCLSSLDDLLAAHNEKLEFLKGHKKGLMQNLFPQEGERVPKFRFPEFENDGEWEEKKLGVLLEQKPEYGINAAAVEFKEELPTYLRITDISEDGHFLNKEKVSVAKAVTEKNYLVEGDIVLARTGASVGKSYKYRKSDGRLVFAGFLIRIKPACDLLDSEFLFQFVATDVYWKWVKYVSARSGQPGINGTEYSSMPIGIPPSILEQQKIASCLSAVDDLIKAETEKIEALKEHKKGLMQGLFPKMEN